MDNAALYPDELPEGFESALTDLQACIEAACVKESDWPSRVAAGICAAFKFAAANPDQARLLTTEALAGGKAGFARYERLISYLRGLLAPGRTECPDADRLPDEIERALAGGIAMLVAQRLDLNRHHELPALSAEAIQFVLTPYLGIDEAQRIASECPELDSNQRPTP